MPTPRGMRPSRSITFTDDDLDQQAYDFAALAAEAIADVLQLKSGTPHLTERYQRMTHEVFIAIRSTIDSLAPPAAMPASRIYSPPLRRAPAYYQMLRRGG